MVKKRAMIAVVLVLLLAILAPYALAGCCVGVVGCSRAFFESECSSLAAFDSQDCEAIDDCNIVACCHDIPGIPRATYQATCTGITPTPVYHFISEFTTNPAAHSTEAERRCEGLYSPCTYIGCEQENPGTCMCGSALTTDANPFCCARDNEVFSDFIGCSASPSCQVENFYSVAGRVVVPYDPETQDPRDPLSVDGVQGADVWVGGKLTTTDAEGFFAMSLLPDGSSGVARAMKGEVENSTVYTIEGADITGPDSLIITLAVEEEVLNIEICTNGIDDDGDQFGWDSTGLPDPLAADKCDPDCADYFGGGPSLPVSAAYYNPLGEFYLRTDGTPHDLCSDRLDNDCDGLTDCEDIDLETEDYGCDDSSFCSLTTCGDGIRSFPNSDSVYEQCDIQYEGGAPVLDPETGEPIGDDSLCPGDCVPPGQPLECTCRYTVACGNGVVDEPFEDCDGTYVPALGRWDSSDFQIGECGVGGCPGCNEGTCGTPNSARPCQCPPPQLCGDGRVDEPEQCDVGGQIDPETGLPAEPVECGEGACSPDCTCPPSEAICGNNIIEPGEDCDGTLNDVGDFEWLGFKNRKFGCDRDRCALPVSSAADADRVFSATVTTPDGSVSFGEPDYSDYLEAMGVTETGPCTCPTVCRLEPDGPVLETPGTERFKREISLSWTDSCMGENARAYNILRCSAADPAACDPELGAVFSVINEEPWPVEGHYIDDNFEGSTYEDALYHCYMIEGIYDTAAPLVDDDGAPRRILSDFDPEVHCVLAGMEQCYSFRDKYTSAEEFCAGEDSNVRSTCDDQNMIQRVDYEEPQLGFVDCSIDPLEAGEGPHFCVGPYGPDNVEHAGMTQCVPKSICDFCNDPFGLFAYSNNNPDPDRRWAVRGDEREPGTYGRAPESMPSDFDRSLRSGYKLCFDYDFCYMDVSRTTIDMFYELKPESTCYDYHSKEACMWFNRTDGHCEWVWHPLYAELGLGVCRTDIIEEQQCGRCHDPANKVFGRCDQETCGLYGRCYYDMANLDGENEAFAEVASVGIGEDANKVLGADLVGGRYYMCRHEDELSCENYDTVQDCIASASPYSIGGTDVLQSDSVHDVEGTLVNVAGVGRVFNKTGVTNSLTTPSDDFFGFGKCQWAMYYHTFNEIDVDSGERTLRDYIERPDRMDSASCFKNSDNSSYIIDHTERPDYETFTKYQQSDCGGHALINDPPHHPDSYDLLACRQDFVPPITNLGQYPPGGEPLRKAADFVLDATVSDDSVDYAAEEFYPDTYACIASEGLSCYPNYESKADKISRLEGNRITADTITYELDYDIGNKSFKDGVTEGLYHLYYFSEDISHNLEPVRSFPIYIDPTPPNVRFEWTNTSFEVSEDVWRTNLSLHMFIQPLHEADDDAAFCDARMYLGDAHIYTLQDIGTEEIGEYASGWSRNYSDLTDNTYRFEYRCMDDVGNVIADNITLVIDGDKSITNPRPTGTLNDGSVVLGVETGINSECRYQYSVEEDGRFWGNITTDPAVWAAMPTFAVTGSKDSPSTLHESPDTKGNGYHRYYVKCMTLNDGVIRGNAADEIRFAVDLKPPITTYYTSAAPYNGWYDRDIDVSLSCGDPALMGQGFDWSFGCDETYYCLGEDCDDFPHKYVLYDSPITLTETTYISFYSVDKGGNEESHVENVLFQIDKEPPILTVEFMDGDVPADVLVMNKLFRIVVTSNKPFISPAISKPVMSYSTDPSKFADDIELFPTLDPSRWEGLFYLPFINSNIGYEGTGIFNVDGVDYHNVSGSGQGRIRIDTKPPDAPVVEPSLEKPSRVASDYQSLGEEIGGYPIHYHEGVYYTNETDLYITGYTSEYLDMEYVTTVDGVDDGRTFTQTETHVNYTDTVLQGFQGGHEVRVFGDITGQIDDSMSAGFDEEQFTMGPKRAYREYGTFYDISSLRFHGGDLMYSEITVYPVIEESVTDKTILFYDKEVPSYWFGFPVPIAHLQNTTFYLRSYDDAGNLVRYPKISDVPPVLTFFADAIPPVVVNHHPVEGSTSQTEMDVNVTIKEGRGQSGLDYDSLDFKLNGDNVEYSVTHNEVLEEIDPANEYYVISTHVTDLDNGEYDVAVTGRDLSMNQFDETSTKSEWTFSVDRNIPADPIFTLLGGFHGPPGDDRWYVRTSPDFIIDFSAEPNPVTIVDVFTDDVPTEGSAATCTNTSYNVFRCEFTTPKSSAGAYWADYGVRVDAFKTLDDGTDSKVGNYGWFYFTVDDQPPDFTPAFQTRFRDDIELSLDMVVTNEKHALFADLDILGEHYVPLHSSNNGSLYHFVWEVPDYDKEQEGPTPMVVTLSDFAGNSRSVSVPVYVDLTAPRMRDIGIDVSNTIFIGDERFTSNPVVTVTGNFVVNDTDVSNIWIEPGNYDETTGVTDNRTYGTITYDEDGSRSFEVVVTLADPNAGQAVTTPFIYNEMLISQINDMQLFARDIAGHERSVDLRVIRDVAAPLAPVFCLGTEWYNCIRAP